MTPLTPTEPEPAGDVHAQFLALIDPRHPKRAVWVSAGTTMRCQARPYLDLEAGRLHACQALCDELAAEPSQETLARILDYVECKPYPVMSEMPVVQALTEDGWVVQEMLSSWSRVGAALARARAYGRVRVLSMAACLERRQRLIEEERERCQS